MRNDIQDEKLDSTTTTPHYRYSVANGFNPNKYFVNGLIANVLYTTKEHPNRPYKGIYLEANIRYNTSCWGAPKKQDSYILKIRKYWSLSERNPEHVLAFWYWGSYLLWGKLPYLELPGTSYDTYNRSGRGYTLGRFRGPDFDIGKRNTGSR